MKQLLQISFLAFYVSSASASESPYLLSLHKEGIPTLPSQVLIVSKDKERSIRAFCASTNQANREHNFGLFFDPETKTMHIFSEKDEISPYDLKENDFSEDEFVVYTYRFSKEEEKSSFLDEHHDLQPIDGGSLSLYILKKGMYLQVLEKKERVFKCSMHPQVRSIESGSCPICGLNLIQVNDYR